MDIDHIFNELGGFGNYQIRVYAILFFPLIYSSLASLSYVFTAGDIDYRCKIAECDANITSFEEPWLIAALPHKNGKLDSHCRRFKSVDNNYHENCTDNIFFLNETEECHSFVFKNKENTITKEFNLLCEENYWKRTLVGTVHNAGLFIGILIGGIFSDRFGRKKVIIAGVMLSSFFAVLRSLSTNYIQFLAFELIDAVAAAGIYPGIFVLGMEMTEPKKRTLGGTVLSCYYSVGGMMLGALVWFVDDWRTYLRIISIPGFFVFIFYRIMPESLRWLIAHGKIDETLKTLQKLSILDKNIEQAGEQLEELKSMGNDESKHVSSNQAAANPMVEIFRSSTMLSWVLICSYCWATNAFVFYGLSLSSVAIAGNKFLNFILISFVEIPASMLVCLVADTFGRKLSLFVSLVISGLSCIMFHFIDDDMLIVRLMLFLTGKCAITVAFTVLYILASEMFPTNMRNSLIGFCSTVGRCGSMIAPQMPLVASYMDPALIFAAASFIAGVFTLLLPETLNCKLPDTVEEAEVIGKGKEIFSN